MCIRDRANTTPSPVTSLNSEQEGKIKQAHRDITLYIRDTYAPHFNLYQRNHLTEKMKCFENNRDAPDKYYSCIEGIESKMYNNSLMLQQKFGAIDNTDRECQMNCRTSFPGMPDKVMTCINKCLSNMRESCINIYDKFYEQTLSSDPEFKKLKKQVLR
eukprot:TRINITY_DN3062_c0_g1_i18.p2 TRINITY_DN3062_c0_g1~~TRINITY_DN3062_c0_g1_i18.p2  ORF type:complete len:186 (+),score=70.03 TRINITY_DN3062_c0_g1_i18:84-560(+)